MTRTNAAKVAPAPRKKYELTPEHRAQLEPWRDRWIANAMSTKAMTDEEKAAAREAAKGLYRAAGLEPPPDHRIVFVPSPFVMRFAGGFAAGIWWLRRKGAAATYAATGAATGAATDAATDAATYAATRAATTADRSKWYKLDVDGLVALARELFRDRAEFGLGCASYAWRMWQGGNQWSGWSAYLSFFRHVAKLDIDYSKWQHWEALSELSGPRIMHADFCIISDRPSVLLVDSQNRPHCDDGPFCRWRDGTALYAIRGTRVPWWIVEHPEQITVASVDAEANAEVRRVMVERYGRNAGRPDGLIGAAAYLKDAGAELLDEDMQLTKLSGWAKGSAAAHIVKAMPWAADYVARDDSFGPGRLYRRNVPDDEPIVMVELVNASPELDGSLKTYMLRVPPTVRTCREAVAWTFGLSVEQWQPAMET